MYLSIQLCFGITELDTNEVQYNAATMCNTEACSKYTKHFATPVMQYLNLSSHNLIQLSSHSLQQNGSWKVLCCFRFGGLDLLDWMHLGRTY